MRIILGPKSTARRLPGLALLLALAFAAPAAYATPTPTPSPAPVAVVHVKDFAFHPPTLTIHVGDAVRFVNDDDDAHTVTAKDKSFYSGGLDTHEAWQHTFDKPGRYEYFCALHPYMKAVVIVTAATTKEGTP